MSTIRTLLDNQAKSRPEVPFLLDEQGATVTFSEARATAASIAADLTKRGVKPGESVAYAMSNGPTCALCILGCMYGGFRATAVNLVAGKAVIAYVLKHSESKLVFSNGEALQLIRTVLEENSADPQTSDTQAELVDTGSRWYQASDLHAQARPESLPLPLPESDALLMYTSGTTGLPKGVVQQHSALVAAGRNPTTAHDLQADDRALCVLPLYHINGLCTTLLAPLYSGGSVVMPSRYSTTQFFTQLREHGCTWFSVVPTHIAYLIQHGLANPAELQGLEAVRFGRSASAPLSPEMHERFESLTGISIVETMGLTETSGQITANPMHAEQRKIGSVGRAHGNEIIIVDDTFKEAPVGKEGEILVRGDNVLKLYLKNKTATDDAITAENWFRTGDLGTMDEDGFIFVTGRLKELIIKGGENIAPREIDEALMLHPDVIEAAAFARPCQRYGQRVEAAVRLTESASVTEQELILLCEQQVGEFKRPDQVYFLGELPKGPSLKIQRNKLPELCQPR